MSKYLVVPLSLAVMALAMSAPLVAASNGGNSENAKLCQKGGWMDYTTSDGTPFANQDDCVSYAANGGTLSVTELDQYSSTTTGTLKITSTVNNTIMMGQTFTAGITGQLTSAAVWPLASLAGYTLEIRPTDAYGYPTSDVLASQVITSSATDTWATTTFDAPADVTAGTQYALIVVDAAGSGSIYLANGADDYAGGSLIFNLYGIFDFYPDDLAFETYVTY